MSDVLQRVDNPLEATAAQIATPRTTELERVEVAHLPAVATSRVKIAMDVVLATVGLIVLLPSLLLIGLFVCLDSRWPPLYSQRRVGLNGRTFRMWKFRTMVNGADGLREQLMSLNEAPFPAFKLRRDPRVTRVGRFLQKTSIDELPQLWNVLTGDMSLVGPRPALPGEVEHYDTVARRRLRARPGLTCIWQIESRHRSGGGFDQWLEQDIDYINRWSIGLDVELIAKSVREVVRMSGH